VTRIVQEYFDEGTKTFYINEVEDVSPLLDSLQEERNHAPKHAYKRNAARWRKVGEIPLIILDKWYREGFNALAPNAGPEVLKRIQRDYPYLLAVDKL
jgi:hypothetical protein